MTSVPSVTLAPGLSMPAIGYGVGTAWFKSAGGDKDAAMREGITNALDAGFRHIDEAEMYKNEESSGKALQEWMQKTSTSRQELWVTHKVTSPDTGIAATCQKSLDTMGLGYFDLYLIHSPFDGKKGDPFKTSLRDAWAEMEGLVDAGKVRAIGVSNWRILDLEEIFETARIKPVCNQVEAHPYLQQRALLSYCQARNIVVTAYAPQLPVTKDVLQGGPVDGPVSAAAQRLGVTPGQVLLRWSYQTGRIPISTTSKPERMQEYLGTFNFVLNEEEVAAISAAGLQKHYRSFWRQCPQFSKDPSDEPDSKL